MTELVGEIRNSIQYFASLPGRLPVSRVLVTGGGSALFGLLPMLEAQVRLPVVTVSPLVGLDTSRLDLSEEQAAEVGPVLATPIGLALPEPDKAVKKFNLIPPEVAKRMRMKRVQERTLLASVAVLVVLVLFGGWKFYQVHSAQNSVDALNQNIATLNAQVPKYDLVVAANNAYSAGVARRASVLNSAVDWPLALTSLISITPANAKVLTFTGAATNAAPPRRLPPPLLLPPRPPVTTAAGSTISSGAIGTSNWTSMVRARACQSRRHGSMPLPDQSSSPTRCRDRRSSIPTPRSRFPSRSQSHPMPVSKNASLK